MKRERRDEAGEINKAAKVGIRRRAAGGGGLATVATEAVATETPALASPPVMADVAQAVAEDVAPPVLTVSMEASAS